MTTGQALDLVFPKCEVKRSQVLLDDAKRAAIRKLCGQKVDSRMVFPYVATRGGKVVGTAWFDAHKVRSKRQLLMVAVDPQQRVLRVEVLGFAEPEQYGTPPKWRKKLVGRSLGGVTPGKDVPRITGATMTVTASTRCVERILATHRVVFGARPESRPTSRPTGRKGAAK